MQQRRLIFLGTPDFALPALQALYETGQYDITVVTAPDKPAGRGQRIKPPPVKVLAQKLGLFILQPSGLNDDVFLKQLKNIQANIAIVVAYGKIIPKKYLVVPEYGFLNIHPSLLPKYRGPSPIQSAIMNGEKETGVSLMVMDEQIDHGPILATTDYRLQTTDYYPKIAKDLAEIGAKFLVETLPDYLAGKIKPAAQDDSSATYTALLSRKDGQISWNDSAEKIYNYIRGLNPNPGTWTTWRGKTLRILRAKPLPFRIISTGVFGDIVKIKSNIIVKTGSCPLELQEVQLEASRPMSIDDFLNGHPGFINSRVGE